jgi:glyoxylase-like metal-dependent hydrolase (beta-lactamase superfamily II)
MLETKQFGEVTQLIMGRAIDGNVLYRVAAYLVDGLLIDTGCRHTAEELLDYMKNQEISKVFITHYHEDHIGGAALLKRELGLDIMACPRTVEAAGHNHKLYPYQELVWGYPERVVLTPLREDKIKTENCLFKVIDTPGHSEDHVVLYEPGQGWCFSGDLFVSERIKVLRPEEKAATLIASMEKLAALSERLILFTAIGKVEEQGREKLKACTRHLDQLKKQALALSREEGLNEEQIAEQIFGGESTMAALTDSQFATKHLIHSLLEV